MVLIDNCPETCTENKLNSLQISSFNGDNSKDYELLKILEKLMYISDVDDVRLALK